MKVRSFAPFSLACVLMLAACSPSINPTGPGEEGSSSSAASEAASEEGLQPLGEEANVRVIDIDAKNWAFTPNAITVAQGEEVMLRVTSSEGNHGFAVADLDIDVSVPEGETVEIILPTDTAGTFSFQCSIPCGEGHKDMTGTIEVTAS